jgi:hypothetical protein
LLLVSDVDWLFDATFADSDLISQSSIDHGVQSQSGASVASGGSLGEGLGVAVVVCVIVDLLLVVDSSGLVPLLVVDFFYSLLAGVSSIDCLCIVVRDIGELAGFGY